MLTTFLGLFQTGSLWKRLIDNPGNLVQSQYATAPKGNETYYADPYSVAEKRFYSVFGSQDCVELLKRPQVTPDEWIAIYAGLYGGPSRRILQNEPNVSTLVSTFGITCCSAMVNRCLSAPNEIYFHQEHVLAETSSKGVSGARRTPGLRPDYVCAHYAADPIQFRVVGEGKHIVVLEGQKVKQKNGKSVWLPLNLAAAYGDMALIEVVRVAVKNAVDQLYTYMCVMKLKYGFLTSYNTWWFFTRKTLRLGDGNLDERLYISEPITPQSKAPTLAEAFSLFVLTAVQDETAIGMSPPSRVVSKVKERYNGFPNDQALEDVLTKLRERFAKSVQAQRDEADGGGGGDGVGTQNTLGELDQLVQVIPSLPLAQIGGEPTYVRKLGHGRTGVAMLGQIDGFPCPVAIKIADMGKADYAEAELKNEFKSYLRMASLWGTVVPFLVWAGRMAWGRVGLATSFAGSTTLDKYLQEHKSIDDMVGLEYKLCDGLDRIHAVGVAHGDIEMKNIVVDEARDGLEVKFIDFGNSLSLTGDETNDALVRKSQQVDVVQLRDVLTAVKALVRNQVQGCDASEALATSVLPVNTAGHVVLLGSSASTIPQPLITVPPTLILGPKGTAMQQPTAGCDYKVELK
jgi:tRNA A-37 threonylcarbamoyl transferase component Bud32